MAVAERHVSVPVSFSGGDIVGWLKRFEICSKTNKWTAEIQALKLHTLLEGESLAVWLELSEELLCFYAQMMLKKLFGQVIPELTDDTVKRQLILHQFLSGIPKAIRKQIHASGDVRDFPSIVECACLLMMVNVGSCKEGTAVITNIEVSKIKKLEEQFATLTEQVVALSKQSPHLLGRKGPASWQVCCYKCNRVGHTLRECQSRQGTKENRRCFACGQIGHLARDCQYQGNDPGMLAWASKHPTSQ